MPVNIYNKDEGTLTALASANATFNFNGTLIGIKLGEL